MDSRPHPRFKDLGPLSAALVDISFAPIIGLPLTGMWHPIFQTFEFGQQFPGKNRKGQDVTFSEWRFDVWRDWQVTFEEAVILGSNDVPYTGKANPKRFFDRKTPPRESKARARWRTANAFFELVRNGALVVESISLQRAGSLQILLSHGYQIRTFRSSSEAGDMWCLMNCHTKFSFWAGATADGPIAWMFEAEIDGNRQQETK